MEGLAGVGSGLRFSAVEVSGKNIASRSGEFNLTNRLQPQKPMGLFTRTSWAVYDCKLGTFDTILKVPFVVGSGSNANFKISDDGGVRERHFQFYVEENGNAFIESLDPDGTTLINGSQVTKHPIVSGQEYLVKAGNSFLIFNGCGNVKRWSSKLRANSWVVIDGYGAKKEPMTIEGVASMVSTNADIANLRVALDGVTTVDATIPVSHLVPDAVQSPDTSTSINLGDVVDMESSDEAEPVEPQVLPDGGPHRCPYCLRRFKKKNIMWVATHAQLRPDPILKGQSYRRFANPAYDQEFRVLDSKGSVCTEQACPHCRTELPNGFLELENHILSIVGDHFSGKSYYLAVLVKALEKTLHKNLNIHFSDLNAEVNKLLEHNAQTLMRGSSAGAALDKTTKAGVMYREININGHQIEVPRPFIYKVNSDHNVDENHGLTFYDHAGEWFQPGQDAKGRPRTRHVSCAGGITFMFDPFSSIEFRQRMIEGGTQDPQIKISPEALPDRHASILSEIGGAIRELRQLSVNEKIDEPLAFVVGKYDAWRDCFPTRFENPMESPVLECFCSEGECRIGRAESDNAVDIDLPLATISRQHADLNLQKDRIEITDLDSKYGTYVDGIKLRPHQPTAIKPFSKVRLGKYILELDCRVGVEGKYSYAIKLLEAEEGVSLDAIRGNSDKLRGILNDICPELVDRAEQISHSVSYFPVSTFGHTPVEHKTNTEDSAENTVGRISPDPKQIRPYLVEVPALWLMLHALPSFIPVSTSTQQFSS